MKLLKSEQNIVSLLELQSERDLLFNYPYRYEEMIEKEYIDWKIDDKVIFSGKLVKMPSSFRKGRLVVSRFEVLYNDEVIKVTIFNRPWLSNYSQNTITIIGQYKGNNNVTAINYNSNTVDSQVGINPMYHLKDKINYNKYRDLLKKVFNYYQDTITDIVPNDYRIKYRLLRRMDALKKLHFPVSLDDVNQALRTLKYEEFLVFQVYLNYQKKMRKKTGYAMKINYDDVYAIANKLPFSLTNGQIKSINEILNDLSQPDVMRRLLQGDVGSGKTLVAGMAVYAVYLAGKQTAFMVPTEVLAKQQYLYFVNLFKHTNMKIGYLFSSMKPFQKNAILEELENHQLDLVVGTHALFQDSVNYSNLGLVVTDEQHRFGVNQREKLVQKGEDTNLLLMSATPIPRTMASVIYAGIDISTIDSLPQGRKKIITKVSQQNSLMPIFEHILNEINNGQQIYIICPAIEDSNISGVRTVADIFNALNEEINGKRKLNIKIDYIHGKLTSEDKDDIMTRFKKNDIKILISTTVIEVGVNVENANTIVIYNADRFGLAQLHQLRGRVGRGDKQAYCFLLTDNKDLETLERLNIMERTTDGFEISEYDLKTRGPGDVLGVRQSGYPTFEFGDLDQDFNILKQAQIDAVEIVSNLDKYKSLMKVIESKEVV